MTLNKKFLQCLACLLILMFHLWINVSGTQIENFIIKTAYIGVDIFFFVSAYSLADKKIEYKPFIKNRFINIYLKFIIFSLIVFIYKKYSFIRLLKIITGIELFEKGGGSFLWFIPAIMIFYLIYPLFIKWDDKKKGLIVLIVYLLLAIGLSYYSNYRALYIFINRIPIMLVGYYLKNIDFKLNNIIYIFLTIIGLILLYMFGYKNKLNVPIKETFYLVSIVLIIGISGLSNLIKNNRLINLIASLSLEIYAFQMIFGYDIASFLYKTIKISLISNLLTIVLIILISYIFQSIFKRVFKNIR